jgi:hypothetical protein
MWLLQKNIWKEEKYNQLLELLDRYEIEYKVLNIIPFSDELEEKIDFSKVEMIFGSIKMTDLCRKHGLPVFYGENFDYKVWGRIFKNTCLNWDSKICRIRDLKLPIDKDVFVRPVLDDKSFSGTVLRAGDTFDNIQFGTSKERGDIVIQVAPVKKIYSESRYFVVGGNIITGSFYRSRGRIEYQNLDVQKIISNSEWQFASKMIKKWEPADMFVIDIADTPDGYKIIEFGCIHNCGFYDINLSKLIQAIQEYYTKET